MNEKLRGRGAQYNPDNRFLSQSYAAEHIEGLDEEYTGEPTTQVFFETPKKIVNKIDSPDVGMWYSLNPYQGCEHGCIYCYARNSHEFWGYSAGLDFERKIIVKPEAPALLEAQLQNPKWIPAPISLSGNTDCYQPLERKYQITRKLLQVFLKFRHPVGIITKNSLVLRDLDILRELAELQLVHVFVSVTSLDEKLRLELEPRTSTAANRLKTIEKLTAAGIPSGVMAAPMIPGLNSHEMTEILKSASEAGAVAAGYTMVRLNGAIGDIFTDWIKKTYPGKAQKVLNLISSAHGGKLNDSRFGVRMRGDGNYAETMKNLFEAANSKYFFGKTMPEYNLQAFKRPGLNGQMQLF